MARRIPITKAKPRKSKGTAKKASRPARAKVEEIETGEETVVWMPPEEKVFEVPVEEDLEATAAPEPIGLAPVWGSVAPPEAREASTQGLPKWRQTSWRFFPFWAGIFLVSVVIQVYLAGASVFGALPTIEAHKTFIHVVEIFPPLMVIFGFLGGRKSAGWWSVGLMAAISLQYALAGLHAGNPSPTMRYLSALHVVNALFIFGVALMLVHRHPFWRHPSPA